MPIIQEPASQNFVEETIFVYGNIKEFSELPLEAPKWKEARLRRNESVKWLMDEGASPHDLLHENMEPRTTDLILDQWYEAKVRKPEFWNGRFGAKSSSISEILGEVELWPRRSTSFIVKGSLQFMLGNFSAAHDCYEKAVLGYSMRGDYIDQSSWGCYTSISPADTAFSSEMQSNLQLPEIDFISEPANNGPTYLVTCDEIYFVAFAENMSNSVARFSPNSNLHFHVVNAKASTHVLYTKMPPNVTLSTEHLDESEIGDIRAYYTCVRFLRAREFLKRWEIPILMIDADGHVTGDLIGSCLNRCTSTTSMGFRAFFNFPAYQPWRRVSANCLLALPCAETYSFFSLFERLFELKFNRKFHRNWWIDQNILDACFRHLSEHGLVQFVSLGKESASHLSLLHSKGNRLEAAKDFIKTNGAA